MKIIGCDFHPSFQQISMLDDRNQATSEKEKHHALGRSGAVLPQLQGPSVRVGIEACGNTRGSSACCGSWDMNCSSVMPLDSGGWVRKQKNDERDAESAGVAGDRKFPRHLGAESGGARSAATVAASPQAGRTADPHQESVAACGSGPGVQKKRQLWTERGRQRLLSCRCRPGPSGAEAICCSCWRGWNRPIAELSRAVEAAAQRDPRAQLLRTHPGVGPITALAFVLVIRDVQRFQHSHQLASYLGLIPSEDSSAGRRRLGAISKQGNTLLRTLLVEAGQSAARRSPAETRVSKMLHRKSHTGIGKVMVARKLAVRLYWMLRSNQPYPPARMQGGPSHPVTTRSGSSFA